MSNNSRRLRTALLAGASTALITGLASTPALAQSVSQTGTSTITVQQEFNDFTAPAATQTLDGNTDGSVEVDIQNDDEANYALQNSTVTVGSSATTGNSTSATGYANSGDLTVNADLNNVAGSGYSSLNAGSNGDTSGATVSSATDIGIALTQQNINTAAAVGDATNIGVTLDNGADASTVTIAGNRQSATGVLNSGTTLVDASANNSSGSSGLGVSQSSVNATLDVSVSSLAQFSTGSGTSEIGLNDSTAALTDNSQAATAVANSGSNAQAVAGNDLSLAANPLGAATASTIAVADAAGGYATASNQELSGGNPASIGAVIDSAAGGYVASVDGDVVGSILNNDRNSASALARGNEVVNATTIDANSVTTPGSGTVAAVASSQKITGEVAINAGVTGVGPDRPLVANVITGDVGVDSAVTASGNAVLVNAAGNRGGNSINAAATTINTLGTEAGSATNGGATVANAAFAVASNQGVSSETSITAGLVDDVATPTEGTSISTAIGGSVVNSSVASLNNSLTASAAGNQSLTGGNAITLTGTNVATTAAVSSAQVMDGDLTSTIGSAGTAPVLAGTVPFTFTGASTGGAGNYEFTGTALGSAADRDALAALYPTLTFTHDAGAGTITVVAPGQVNPQTTFAASYTTGGSAGSPASGGVVVTVGNDITNSSVAVDGNATSGSAIGNSGTNRILADATNFANGSTPGATDSVVDGSLVTASADMAVSNSQSVGEDAVLASTVGAVFGITAEGATTPTLSDVSASTLSVSDNSESALVKGNEAGNSVRLSATNLSTSSALASNQQMDGDVIAEIADFSGAFATIGRDVTASTVQVDGNDISGTTFGNDVANTVAVLGSSTITAGGTTVRAIADPSTLADDEQTAVADHSLANVQNVGTGTLRTTVEAGYGIATLGAGAPGGVDDTSDVANSILSVSGNVQSAATTGSNAANAVNIAGGSITTNGALLSVQTSDASEVLAGSTMEVGAPAANTSSTLSLNGNANSASATVNDATNSMTVAADTSLASRTTDAGLSGTPADDYVASADYVVNNFQQVGAADVGAVTNTIIANNDDGAFATDGIQQSTVDVIGNTAQATATSNRSVNSLALSANSSDASAGVLNQQDSAAAVTASAVTIAGTDVTGYSGLTDASPINGSAATVANNATLARAGGNTATNSLSAAATTFANVSGGAVTALNGAGSDAITASFAVLNEQTNGGPINASVSVTYGTAFDAVGAVPSVVNSSSMVNGNSAATVAYGNAATNQVTFAALNSPAAIPGRTSAGIASNQLNTGDVGAFTSAVIGTTASGAGVAAGGAVNTSSVSVNGNALSASAFGNSSSNTLTISGNNVNVGPALIP
ncbi:MAG: S-layer family protein [Sphingobium limneticum]